MSRLTEMRTEEQVQEAIKSLDLDPIKIKLMDKKEGLGWTLDEASEAERWYRRFLFLNFKYPERSIVPTSAVDKFWHFHILDTKKYAEDCERIFGYFLHHFPYFGMRGEEDAENLKRCFAETREIFEREFGEVLSVSTGVTCSECDSSACDGQPSCGSSCTGESASSPVHSMERPHLVPA